MPNTEIFDLLPKTDYNFSVGEGITAAYTVTSQGEIISAEISYNFENDRDVSFIIYREEDSGKILTGLSVNLQLKFDFGPEGKPLVRAVDTDIHLSSSVNYERTLRNLVKILKKETFAGKDLTSLFNFHYQCASVSDIQVPDKTFLH